MNYALVIGIAHYPGLPPPHRDLEGPVQDAYCFTRWLLAFGGVAEADLQVVVGGEVTLPITGPQLFESRFQALANAVALTAAADNLFSQARAHWRPCRPIKDEIDSALRRLMERAEGVGGPHRLYVYFGGHGFAREAAHVALLMANASTSELNHSLNASAYHQGLAQRQVSAQQPLFQEQIFFYDCCRSLDKRVLGLGPPWNLPEDPSEPAVTQFVFFGAGFNQQAHPCKLTYSTKRGLFTHALLEGLWAGGRVMRGGWEVTHQSLIAFVKGRMAELAASEVLPQSQVPHPILVGAAGTLRLATYNLPPAPITARVVPRVPSDQAVDVYADDQAQVMVSQPVTSGCAEFQLPPGTYTFIGQPSGTETTVQLLVKAEVEVPL